MPLLTSFPENSVRRLIKVIVRTIHLIGVAGIFGHAMAHTSGSVYLALALGSGLLLVVMEAYSGLIWLVQIRGVATLAKLLILLLMHQSAGSSVPYLVVVIVISGFMSHAPSWIRYYSLQHRKVILSSDDLLG